MVPMLDKLGYKPANRYLAPREAPQVKVDEPPPKKSLVELLKKWAGA
jgi:hypothetical protein